MPDFDIFVYGTLRADYLHHSDMESVVDVIAPNHYRIGNPGDWILHDHALWCLRPDGRVGIPAIGKSEGCTVVGDVIRVGFTDLASLCRYEGFPNLYHLSSVEVQNRHSGWHEVFCFMPDAVDLTNFGIILPSGDYVDAVNNMNRIPF